MILPLSNGVQQQTGLGWAWQWTVLGSGVVETPEYFPRRTLYGTYTKRAELTGGVLPRVNLIGTKSRRVNLTGGEG